MISTARKLTKQTIKPVIKFIGGWGSNIHSLNTKGAEYYHFTLDTYKGKNSFTGGFAWSLDGCYDYNNQAYDEYAINLETGIITNLETKETVFTVEG